MRKHGLLPTLDISHIVQEMRRHFFIRLTHLVESWDLNFLKLLYLGSLNQRDVLKNMRQIYTYGLIKEVE